MKTMLDAFLDDLTRGLYAQTQTGTYVPTLVIGLGGTGLKVLRHLKKALNRHQSQEIRLLGIETDDSENNKYPAIPPLEPKELVDTCCSRYRRFRCPANGFPATDGG